MKKSIGSMAMVLALGLLAMSSAGAVVVGSDDFESYDLGPWSSTAANPSVWYNGDNAAAISANIVDEITTSLELQLDINLQDSWQVGLQYELSCTNNESIYIDDYSMEFYLRIPPVSLTNLTQASSLVLSIRDPNDSSRGSAYSVANYDPGYSNVQSGAVLTIPLGSGDLAVGSSVPMDGSVTNWQIEFRIDSNKSPSNQPITIAIDDMVVTYTKPPFLNTTWSPMGFTTNNPVVSSTAIDGTKEVESLMLYVDGDLVSSNNYAGGSTTNTISYDWVGAPGGSHTGMVVVTAADAYAETNTWTFLVPAAAPAPATVISKLYSFNFAGIGDPDPVNQLPYLNADYQHSVTNGSLAAAPSLGSNIWNNLFLDNPWHIWDPYDHTLVDSNGDTNAPCVFRFANDGEVGAYENAPWNWYYEFNNFLANTATENTMWPVFIGDSVTDLDLIFDGLDPNEKYDFYMYFTSNREIVTDTTTYSLVEGTAPQPVATLLSSWDSLRFSSGGSVTNYAEGTNYCVITSVSPTAGGNVTLNVNGSSWSGGICAMQIAMRDDGGPVGPTINPSIQTMTMAGGMATLVFESESGFTYTVNRKGSLMETSWTAVTNVTGAGASTAATVPTASDAEFFMIEGN